MLLFSFRGKIKLVNFIGLGSTLFLFVTIILSFFLQWGVVAECVIPKFHHSTIRCWE